MLLSLLGTMEFSYVLWRRWDLVNTGHCGLPEVQFAKIFRHGCFVCLK